MRRYVTALALFGAGLLVANGLTADEKKAEEKDTKLTKKELSKLMKDTHRGEKSPHTRIALELKKEGMNWEQFAKDAKAIEDMGKAFKNARLDYVSPAKYIESAAALTKAAGDKDRKAAGEAFVNLTKSCGACHNYGGAATALAFDADRLLK